MWASGKEISIHWKTDWYVAAVQILSHVWFLQPHGLWHARLLYPPLSPGICSNSCPLSWWCYLTILFSAIPFSFCPHFSPASGSFPMVSALRIKWPKYWSFSFSISPFNKYSELISFRINWLDLLVVQGTFKSLLQHHSLKASDS